MQCSPGAKAQDFGSMSQVEHHEKGIPPDQSLAGPRLWSRAPVQSVSVAEKSRFARLHGACSQCLDFKTSIFRANILRVKVPGELPLFWVGFHPLRIIS